MQFSCQKSHWLLSEWPILPTVPASWGPEKGVHKHGEAGKIRIGTEFFSALFKDWDRICPERICAESKWSRTEFPPGMQNTLRGISDLTFDGQLIGVGLSF